MDFDKITAEIYIGSFPANRADVDELKAVGIIRSRKSFPSLPEHITGCGLGVKA